MCECMHDQRRSPQRFAAIAAAVEGQQQLAMLVDERLASKHGLELRTGRSHRLSVCV